MEGVLCVGRLLSAFEISLWVLGARRDGNSERGGEGGMGEEGGERERERAAKDRWQMTNCWGDHAANLPF